MMTMASNMSDTQNFGWGIFGLVLIRKYLLLMWLCRRKTIWKRLRICLSEDEAREKNSKRMDVDDRDSLQAHFIPFSSMRMLKCTPPLVWPDFFGHFFCSPSMQTRSFLFFFVYLLKCQRTITIFGTFFSKSFFIPCTNVMHFLLTLNLLCCAFGVCNSFVFVLNIFSSFSSFFLNYCWCCGLFLFQYKRSIEKESWRAPVDTDHSNWAWIDVCASCFSS